MASQKQNQNAMWKQIYYVNTNQKKVCIAVLTSHEVDFKIRNIKR